MGDDRVIHIHVHIPPTESDPRLDLILERTEAMSEAVAGLQAELDEANSIDERQTAVINALVGILNQQTGEIRDLGNQLAEQGFDRQVIDDLAAQWDQRNAAALAALAQAEAAAGIGGSNPDPGNEPATDPEVGAEDPEPTPDAPGDGTAESAPGAENGGEAPAPTEVEAEAGALVDAGSSADVPEPTPDLVQAERNSPADTV